MKKNYLIFICLLFSTCIFCQERVPAFYGIPIDGTKEEMIQKLVETGNFIEYGSSNNNYDLMEISKEVKDLAKELGITSFVKIHTEDSKVVAIQQDILHLTAENAKLLFNTFYIEYKSDSDFDVSLGDSIPEKEDIFYEMRFNKKKYNYIVNNHINPLDVLTDIAEGLDGCEFRNKIFYMHGCEIEEMDEFGEFMIKLTFVNVRNFCSNKIE